MNACPYDALYINPETQTAHKCNFCSHRVEVGLEPSCVIVCPTQSIFAGDIEDPTSQDLDDARPPRDPRHGHRSRARSPHVFYKGADKPRSTRCARRIADDGMIWADTTEHHPTLPCRHRRATASRARRPHRVHDRRTRWHGQGKVSAYLVTKADQRRRAARRRARGAHRACRSTRAFVGICLAAHRRCCSPRSPARCSSPTSEQPRRFYYIFTRPHWGSWLVRGALILLGYGAVRLRSGCSAVSLDAPGLIEVDGDSRSRCSRSATRRLHSVPVRPVRGSRFLADTAAPSDPAGPSRGRRRRSSPARRFAAVRRARTTFARRWRGCCSAALRALGFLICDRTASKGTDARRAGATSDDPTATYRGRFWGSVVVGLVAAALGDRRRLSADSSAVAAARRGRGDRSVWRSVRGCIRPGRPVRAPVLRDGDDHVTARRSHRSAQANLTRIMPGAQLTNYPPVERWDDWVELDAKAWAHGEKRERRYRLIPTTCFNCEACCGLLAYVDKCDRPDRQVRRQPRPTRPAAAATAPRARRRSPRCTTPSESCIR